MSTVSSRAGSVNAPPAPAASDRVRSWIAATLLAALASLLLFAPIGALAGSAGPNSSVFPTIAAASVADLSALKLVKAETMPAVLERQGFAAAGDGGGARYGYSASPCRSPDDGAQIPAATGGCFILDWPAAPDVRIWGARGGSNDDTAAIQAASKAACARKGGPGTLAITGVHRVTTVDFCPGLSILGHGRMYGDAGGGGAVIVCTGSEGACLRWNHGGTNYGVGGGISGLGIDASAHKGVVIEQVGLQNFTVEKIGFFKPTTAFRSLGGDAVVLRDSHFEGVQALANTAGLIDIDSIGGGACAGTANPQTCRSDAVTLQNLDGEMGVTQTGGACIGIHDFAATVTIDHVRLLNCWDGLVTDNPSTVKGASFGTGPSFLRADDLQLDFCRHLCASITDTPDGEITHSYFHGVGSNPNTLVFGCMRYCGGGGPIVSNFNLTDSRIDGAQGACVIVGVPGMIVGRNHIWDCNIAQHPRGVGDAEAAAITVSPSRSAAPADRGRAIIGDNVLCHAYGLDHVPMDGITLAGAADDMHVHDNDTVGCIGKVAPGTGKHNSIHDN